MMSQTWLEFDVDGSDDLFQFTDVYQRVFGKEPYNSLSFLQYFFGSDILGKLCI